LIRERSQAGREVAKAAGRLGGRPLKLTPEKKAAALAMRTRGDMTMSQIAAHST
jgi:DNA invertase Pin-like site-specific DNA recombinase